VTPRAGGGDGVRQILSNALFLLLAYALPRIFTVASVVVAARWLGAERFGAYGAAAAFAVILSVVASLGMLPLLVRDIARAPARAGPLLRGAHRVKAISGTLMLAAAWGLSGPLFAGRPDARAAALVLALGWVAHAFAENLAAWYQAVERMARWTQASALFGIVSAVVGVALLLVTGSIAAYCAGFVAGWLAALAWLHAGVPPEVRRAPAGAEGVVRDLLRGVAPFAAAFVGLTIYSKVDVLLLQRWSSATEVGLYSAAYKAVDVFQALVIVAAGAVYPRLSRAAAAEGGAAYAARRSMEVLLLGAVPAGLALHLVAGPVVALLFGPAYAGSAPALSWLALLLPLLSLTILGGYVLGAAGRMLPVAGLYGAGLVVNVVLNRALVPTWGAEGAALARLGSETLLLAGFLEVLRRSSGAGPGRRVLGTSLGAGALAGLTLLVPDPTGGWLRAAALAGMIPLLYARSGVVRGSDLAELRCALRRERVAPSEAPGAAWESR